VEGRQEHNDYLENKHRMQDELVSGLKQLAKNRKIDNFNLDLEKLDTMEGRMELV
jgi:hypothetical protein